METTGRRSGRPSFPLARNWAYLDHAAVAPLPRRSAERASRLGRRPGEQRRRPLAVVGRQGGGPARRPGGLDRRRSRRDRLRLEHDPGHRPGRRGLPLARGGQRRRPGRGISVEHLSLDEPRQPGRRGPAGAQPRRPGLARGPRDGDGRPDPRCWPSATSSSPPASATTSTPWPSFARSAGSPCSSTPFRGWGRSRSTCRRTPIDFLAADGHKWLLGPEGAGFLYVRRDWIERLRPLGVGWHSVVGSYNTPEVEFQPQAERPALGGGLVQHARPSGAGRQHEPALRDRPAAGLASGFSTGPKRSARPRRRPAGGSLGSKPPPTARGSSPSRADGVDPNAAVQRLESRGVAVVPPGRLRISPHVYNDDDDLRRLARGARRPAGRTPVRGRDSMPRPARTADPFRTAVFTGTFDPITLGHLDVIRRGGCSSSTWSSASASTPARPRCSRSRSGSAGPARSSRSSPTSRSSRSRS